MKLFNQGWIGFEGAPITGRAPTRGIIYSDNGDPTLTGAQEAFIAHAYKLFCDAVKHSAFPGGYHVQHRKMPDGSTVVLQSINGNHEVRVTISPRKGGSEYLRGFVLRPIWPAASPPEWRRDPILIWNTGPGWTARKVPYKPGSTTVTPTYFVATRRSDHERPRKIVSDQKYGDVYTQYQNILYKNGVKFKAMPDHGMPLVIFTPPPVPGDPEITTYYSVTDSEIKHLQTDGTLSAPDFSRNVAINVLVSGEVFALGVRYDQDEEKLKFATLNLTIPGALQHWHVTASLLPEPPWVTTPATTSGQFSATTPLMTAGGWVYTSEPVSGAPLFGVQDSRALIAYWVYNPPPTNNSATATYAGNLVGSTLSAPGQTQYKYTYTRSNSDGATQALYDDMDCGYARSISVNNTLLIRSCPWSIVNTWGTILFDIGIETGFDYQFIPRSFNAGSLGIGGSTGIIATAEDIRHLVHTDTATASAFAGDKDLYTSSITHTIEHARGDHTDSIADPTVGPPFEQLGGGGSPTTMLRQVPRGYVNYPTENQRTEIFDGGMTTRDYFYYDHDNAVSGYIESTATATRSTINGVTTGSMTATIRIKLAKGGSIAGEALVATYTSPQPPAFPATTPDDVNFGTLDTIWTYSLAVRAAPVFAPLWQTQGLCPFLAYTTIAEEVLPVTPAVMPRLTASFRLQLIKRIRSMAMPDPPIIENVQQFAPFMLEQLLTSHWWDGGQSLFEDLETKVAKLDLSSLGPNLFTDLDLPSAGDTLQGHFYRT